MATTELESFDIYPLANSRTTICDQAPELNVGIPLDETTSNPAKSSFFFKGYASRWDTFEGDVLRWYNKTSTQGLFDSCSDIKIWHNLKYLKVNPFSPGAQVIQIGCEAGMSHAFYENILKPVVLASQAIQHAEKIQNRTASKQDQTKTFGDAWIVAKSNQPKHLKQEMDQSSLSTKKMFYPDVVLRMMQGTKEVRAVGELKFHVTTKLAQMIAVPDKYLVQLEAKQKVDPSNMTAQMKQMTMDPKGGKQDQSVKTDQKFRWILGQITGYMVKYNTRYGFISNYNTTVFLRIDDKIVNGKQEPCVYYSRPIDRSETVQDRQDENISTRLAMLYLTEHCTGNAAQDWGLSQDHAAILRRHLVATAVSGLTQGTPFSKRTQASDDHYARDEYSQSPSHGRGRQSNSTKSSSLHHAWTPEGDSSDDDPFHDD